MSFQSDSRKIIWKMHFKSSSASVYEIISTSNGQKRFWVENSIEISDVSFEFHFPNGLVENCEVIQSIPNELFQIRYIGASLVSFNLTALENGACDLTLIDEEVPEQYRNEVIAGWGSVLMNLKAVVDYDIDLRNHDSKRTWDQGFFEN